MIQATRTTDLLEILARAPDGVYAVDGQQRIILWNRGARDILGYTREEVFGKPCYEVLQGQDEDGCQRCGQNCSAIALARRGMVVPSHTLQVSTKEGEARWVSITHVIVPSERAGLGALVHVFRDVAHKAEAKHLAKRLAAFMNSSGPRIDHGLAPDTLVVTTPLTPREREVLNLLAWGLGTQAIARQLTISLNTTRNHVQTILSKLDVHNRLEAVAYAALHGLLR